MNHAERFNHAKRVIENGGEVERDTCSFLIEELEAAQQRIAELERNQELNLKIKQAMVERFTRTEAELARRDAAAGEPVAFTHESEISNMRATGLYIRGFPADRRLNAEEGYTVALFTSAQASALPWKVESCSNCGSKNHSWDTTVIKSTRVQDGLLKLNETSGLFYLGCDECSETLLKVSADDVANHLNNAKAKGFTEVGD